MMNAFFKRAYGEHKRQIDFKRTFERQTEKIRTIIAAGPAVSVNRPVDRHTVSRNSLLVLFPLVEIAWADGHVTRREMDAIAQAAGAYGLTDDIEGFCAMTERMLSRSSPCAVARMWHDFGSFLESLTNKERETLVYALIGQSRYVAEQSSDSIVGFLRGERVGHHEWTALRATAHRLESAKAEADEADGRKTLKTFAGFESEFQLSRTNGFFDGPAKDDGEKFENVFSASDFDNLMLLVPLVKVAWAEGRITRREREMICAAAQKMGVEPGTDAFQRLSDWFELHPTDEFYASALARLREELSAMPAEERSLRLLDLISDCLNVAGASGGTSRFPAGGELVCDEEMAAVKRISAAFYDLFAAGRQKAEEKDSAVPV